MLIESAILNTVNLIVDQYGNYIVQYILMQKDFNLNKRLIQMLIRNICDLSKQKYSSNVIEKVGQNYFIFSASNIVIKKPKICYLVRL